MGQSLASISALMITKQNMPAILADAHTHLDQYASDDVPGILQRAAEAGVGLLIAAGVTEESSARCVELARRYPMVYAGVGIHPTELRDPIDGVAYQRLRGLARSPRVVCISEVGLDFGEGAPSTEFQEQALRLQVRLARELGLPIIFHSRESNSRPDGHYETLRILREERADEVGGAMHYFQWDEKIAQSCLDLGFCISLAKPLLRLHDLQELVKQLPLDRIVLETDSYPQPFKHHRARWTEPKDVSLVAEKLAELKGLSLQQVADATTGTLLRVLKGRAGLAFSSRRVAKTVNTLRRSGH